MKNNFILINKKAVCMIGFLPFKVVIPTVVRNAVKKSI